MAHAARAGPVRVAAGFCSLARRLPAGAGRRPDADGVRAASLTEPSPS
jgi:hypothetical protein